MRRVWGDWRGCQFCVQKRKGREWCEGGTGGDVEGEASWGVMWLIEVEALMMWMTAFSLMTLAMTR